jgi:homoserine dehydrogenase
VYCEGIRKISAADITYAERLGFVIKLLATAKRNSEELDSDLLQVRVHPTLVPKTHPLASVNGVYNAILIEGDPVGQVMFFGPGAGSGPTASAVVADILNIAAILKVGRAATDANGTPILDPLLSCSHQDYCPIAPIEALVTRFYVRFLAKDSAGVIGYLGTCFGKHEVSLESVVQIGMRDDLAEIVVITHDVREGNFRQALTEIQTFDAIVSIPSVLRVL